MTTDENTEDPQYHSPVAKAIARIGTALDALDVIVDKQSSAGEPDAEMQRMNEDRAKLARDLDSEKARSERLAQINSEVSKRLVGVMETVRHVLDDDSGSKPQTDTD